MLLFKYIGFEAYLDSEVFSLDGFFTPAGMLIRMHPTRGFAAVKRQGIEDSWIGGRMMCSVWLMKEQQQEKPRFLEE